jgi:CHAD domain-containing protein
MELDYIKLKEIKPALAGYIKDSQEMLKISPVPDEEVVHDVRVLMKKARAALKLVAPQIEKDYFERNLSAFKEVGRSMSSWRDSSVHRKTLKELRKRFPEIFLSLSEYEKINELLTKPELPVDIPQETIEVLNKLEDLLNKAGFRIRFETMDKIDPQKLIKEFEISYFKVVDIYLICRNKPYAKNLHELRKRTKDFLYQLWFFRPLNPSTIKQLEKKLDGITQNLGKYNDLNQLIKALNYKYIGGTNPQSLDELIIKIRETQDDYLSRVWPLSYEIFCPGKNLVNVLGFKLLVI